MDMSSFILYTKTKIIYSDIPKDFKTRFDTLIYELDCRKGKNKKVIG